MSSASGSERKYYDDLETRDPERREREQMAALAGQVAHAKDNSPYFATALNHVDGPIDSRAALAELPVIRKSVIAEVQAKSRPLGGLNAVPMDQLRHIFSSPGGIYEPDGNVNDYWRFARALWAAGLRPGDLLHNTFSYHLTPAGMLVESGAHAIGCPVFPGGVGNTELQVQAMADLKPKAYCGTPSFLRILLQKAREMGLDVSSLNCGLVGGEACPPSLTAELSRLGVEVTQNYGTADLGMVAYETEAREGLVLDEGIVVELVTPGTGDPVPEGEVGEVVVTTLNPVYPLIRFATGDLSAILPGTSPCGRTNTRIKGWMGRADQTTKVKGMFVHPSQVAEVIKRHPEIAKARLVVGSIDNVDVMTLRCALAGAGDGSGDDLKDAIAGTIQAVMKVRGQAEFVDAGALPDDGKVIDDVRTYE